jgi:hypothetical protein
VVSVLAALNFLPTLGGGLADADGYLQHISAIAGFDAETNSAVYGQLVHYYRSVQPGWFPLGPAALAIWLVDPGPFLARLLQLAIVLLTFATFAIVARRLFGSSRLAISASVAALALWQLRMPHDPVIGTSFQAPVLAESVLLAYASWYTYGLSRNVFWLWLTCAAAAVASLTDPIGFVLMFALAGMAPLETATRVQSLLVVCTVAIVAVISISHGSLDPPWNRSFYASDVTAQLVAPFPGTYRAFGNVPIGHVAALSDRGLYADDRFDAIPGPSVLGWLFVTGCTVAAALSLRVGGARPRAAPAFRPVLFGLSFWLIPAIMLGPAAIWREGLPHGQSFDSVYLQYFGIAVLMVFCIRLLQRLGGTAEAVWPLFFALAVFLFSYGNVRADAIAEAKTVRLASSRNILAQAAAAGFFNVLPNGAEIAIAPTEPFADGIVTSDVSDAKYAIYHFSKRRFAVVGSDDVTNEPNKRPWILTLSGDAPQVAALDHWAGKNGEKNLTDHAFGYVRAPLRGPLLAGSMTGLTESLKPAPGGFIVEAKRTCGPVGLSDAFVPDLPRLALGFGSYLSGPYGYEPPPETSRDRIFMGGTGVLTVTPSRCESHPLLFSSIVSAAGPGNLAVRYQGHTLRIPISGGAQRISIPCQTTNRPFSLEFKSDAPVADLDPVPFRYERDRPRQLRLELSYIRLYEIGVDTPLETE